MKNVFLLVCFLSLSESLFSQTFSDNREKFAKELNRYLTTHDAKLAKKLMKDFEPIILQGMTNERFNKMVETCNRIDEKKMLPFPDLYGYVSVFSEIEKRGVSIENYQIYQRVLDDYLLKSNTKYAKDYIKQMHDFFEDGVLYRATNFYWYYDSGSFSFSQGQVE
jgi:hypothetical protein